MELLDDPSTDAALAVRSLQDVVRSNRWFGGASAVMAELAPVLATARGQGGGLTLLDVGTGAGDIPELARRTADRAGVRLQTIGLEVTRALAAASRPRSGDAIVGDALALPFADRSVDIVACSQVLHHFRSDRARGYADARGGEPSPERRRDRRRRARPAVRRSQRGHRRVLAGAAPLRGRGWRAPARGDESRGPRARRRRRPPARVGRRRGILDRELGAAIPSGEPARWRGV